jgi:hypothetical protein
LWLSQPKPPESQKQWLAGFGLCTRCVAEASFSLPEREKKTTLKNHGILRLTWDLEVCKVTIARMVMGKKNMKNRPARIVLLSF